MAVQIPLIPSVGFYRFSTTLENVPYVFEVYWNDRDSAWYMHLYQEDETPIRQGIKLVLGALLGIRERSAAMPGGTFILTDLSGQGQDATFDDLGIRVVLWYFDEIT